jgi:hypothetical protein
MDMDSCDARAEREGKRREKEKKVGREVRI